MDLHGLIERDFRTATTFTIDPETAKDFDDALSFTRLSNGNLEIGVHIADASYYLQEGTILDQEAYAEGNLCVPRGPGISYAP
jgi:ribonuclease R